MLCLYRCYEQPHNPHQYRCNYFVPPAYGCCCNTEDCADCNTLRFTGEGGGQEGDCGDAVLSDPELGCRGAEVAGQREVQGTGHASWPWG